MSWLKGLGIAFAALAGVAVVVAASWYVISERRIGHRFALDSEQVALPADEDAPARGQHVAIVRGCTECHGTDLGGNDFIHDTMLGDFYAPNLTPGGVGGMLSPADWERAIRHGIAPDGRGLLIMPAVELNVLGDADLGDLIVYLRGVPSIDRTLPASRPGPLARMLLVLNQVDVIPAEHIDHHAPHRRAPLPGATAAYGGYLASSCTGCHHVDFAGGPIPGEGVTAANLTPDEATGLGRWTEVDFEHVLRTGTRPDGRMLNPVMPWRLTAQMSDEELGALWQYFRSLPAKAQRTE